MNPKATATESPANRRERLRSAAQQYVDVVRNLEHGQARRPLGEHLESLLRDLDSPELTVAIGTLDIVAREWLERLPADEFLLTEGEPLTLRRICLQESSNDSVGLQRVACLLVVGAAESFTAAASRKTIADLQTLVPVLGSAVVANDVPHSSVDPGAAAFQVGRDSRLDVAIIQAWIQSTSEAALAEFFRRRLQAFGELLQRELTQQVLQGEYRRRLLQARAGASRRGDIEQLQAACETVRRQWEDHFSRAEIAQADRVRAQLFPDSRIMHRLQNLQEDLSLADMLVEHSGKSLKLEASSDFRNRARQLVDEALQGVIQQETRAITAELQQLAHESEAVPIGQQANSLILSTPALNADEVLQEVRRRLGLELRYAGEIPRRNWFDWLSHGRRPVFALTMVLSIVGTALGWGTGRSVFLAPMLLVLFLAGTAWACLAFREERRLLLQRELSRLRDVVDNELRRLLDELFRDWQTRVSRYFRETQKGWLRNLSDWSRDRQAEMTSAAERERQETQEQLKALDQRLRETAQQQTQLDRIQSAWKEPGR